MYHFPVLRGHIREPQTGKEYGVLPRSSSLVAKDKILKANKSYNIYDF